MDAGIISHRYARAIYLYAAEHKEEDRLREELKFLSNQFLASPALQRTLADPTVSSAVKIDLLTTAAGKEISDSCRNTIRLIVKNKRTNHILFIATMYDTVYRKAKKLLIMKLTTAVPVSNEVKEKLVELVGQKSEQVEFITEIKDDIIGGFILELEGIRLNAAAKNQLNQLRKELSEKSSIVPTAKLL